MVDVMTYIMCMFISAISKEHNFNISTACMSIEVFEHLFLPEKWNDSYLTQYCHNDKRNVQAYKKNGIKPVAIRVRR